MKSIKIVFTLIVLFFCNLFNPSFAQQYLNDFSCQHFTDPQTNYAISNPFQGSIKPNRTDISGGVQAPDEAYFPVLIVFVQFYGEYSDPYGTWPQNAAPLYLDSLIATSKNINVNTPWWEKYNPATEMFSSHWAEISRGKFHVINPVPPSYQHKAFSVVLPKTALEYWISSGRDHLIAEKMIHNDIWGSIKAQGLTDWRMYDRWKQVNNMFYFCEPGYGDGYVDFIYKIHKSKGEIAWNGDTTTLLYNATGYNVLSGNSSMTDTVIDATNNIKINYGSSQLGSGVTLSYMGTLSSYIGGLGHEHGHQMYMGGHVTYSRVSYGFGGDNFYSPYDMILNEYMTPTNATIGASNYLGDYSSRNTGNGELLKVPISGDEFFLIANRRKVSKWDRIMLGDTAQFDSYKDNTEYGKGVYIYHIENGIYVPYLSYSNPQDLECADGYYEWELAGYHYVNLAPTCFHSPFDWPYYNKKEVLYSNDKSLIDNYSLTGDGVSFHYKVAENNYRIKWWGFGKAETNSCLLGTDRIYTNLNEVYTSNEIWGDRWDPWNINYNQVFSPYSSPSTISWNNDTTGIFIYYKNLNGNSAELQIERASEFGGNKSLSQILLETPPSRPMGVKVEDYYPENGWCVPIVKWNHNREPDMLRRNNTKRYRVYRATQPDMNSVPGNYIQIAEVYIHKDSIPSYIDYDILRYDCAYLDQVPPFGTKFPVRYEIKAFDTYGDSSVYSDFASTEGISPDGGQPGGQGTDHFNNLNVPKEFNLSQNYPNPFNPVTNIKYDLPKDIFVKIKIYDLLGREIKTLVNEYKQAGSYLVSFNGSEFASGIYFYRIEAGGFTQVKRMMLIK